MQTALNLIRQKGVTFSMERIFTERVIFSRRHYDLMTNHISDKYLNKILQRLSLHLVEVASFTYIAVACTVALASALPLVITNIVNYDNK